MTDTTLYVLLASGATALVVFAFMHWKARQKPGAAEAELLKLADDAITKIADTSGLVKIRDAAQAHIDSRSKWLAGLSSRHVPPQS